jgi:hypothetical protein
MYIGPWQEYNLSKTRTVALVNEQLRPNIEQALLSTLDPEVAQKAMEAMLPYFEKQRAPNHPREARHSFQNVGRKRSVRNLPALHTSINSPLAISARERNLQAASPLSVRSTQSEPIKYSYAQSMDSPQTPQASQNMRAAFQTSAPQHPSPLHRPEMYGTYQQPAYDASAAVSLLRLERNAKSRMEIAKLTGWKLSAALNSTGATADTKPVGNSKPAGLSDTKMVQLHALKQQFLAGKTADQDTTGLKLPPLHKNGQINSQTVGHTGASALTLSNVALHNGQVTGQDSPVRLPTIPNNTGVAAVGTIVADDATAIRTPRIGDVDLNDEAFSLVSKYFSSAPMGRPEPIYSDNVVHTRLSHAEHYNAADGIQGGREDPRYAARSNGTLTPMNDDVMSEPRSHYGGSPHLHRTAGYGSQSGQVREASVGKDETEEPVNSDDPYGGGIESLLLWSSQLEADFT